jgi:ribosomal-protein-alanine N-acetyltransferase
MVAVSLRIRRAVQADQHQIANLMYFESRVHRHLDWRAPLDWLGSPYYWVLEDASQVVAVMACPPDPPGIAWIRLFASSSALDAMQAWLLLWETAHREISSSGSAIVAAISLHPWFEDILVASHFNLNQYIVMLEWDGTPIDLQPSPPGIWLRSMLAADLPAVVDIDSTAFDPLWRNSLDALSKAYAQRAYATVAERSGGLVAYQLSTSSPMGAHLARLAVRPEAQGLGVGRALVSDLLAQFRQRGRPHITVNTQSDNHGSQALYERMGFVRTGEQFPVFVHPV